MPPPPATAAHPTTTTASTTDAVAPETKATPAEVAPVTETPAAASEELPKEEKVGNKEVKIEAVPITAGNLGYKAQGPGPLGFMK